MPTTITPGRKIMGRLAQGDDLLTALEAICRAHGITLGEVQAIGAVSQARARAAGTPIEGVANSRACSWNRPPIDRMANLNVEPGVSTLDELIAGVEVRVGDWVLDASFRGELRRLGERLAG